MADASLVDDGVEDDDEEEVDDGDELSTVESHNGKDKARFRACLDVKCMRPATTRRSKRR